jgi:hypothetical protein
MTSYEEQQFLNDLANARNPLLPAAMVAINVPPGGRDLKCCEPRPVLSSHERAESNG